MRLDSSKGISVHVSTCTGYDFNILVLVVRKLFVSTSRRKNE